MLGPFGPFEQNLLPFHIKIGPSCNLCSTNKSLKDMKCNGVSYAIYILQRIFVEHEYNLDLF